MKNKVSLDKFVKENERLLIIYGLFLAILSFSVSDLLKIDEIRGAYISIFVVLVLILLLIEIFMKSNDKADSFSIRTSLFLTLVLFITVTISMGIFKSFRTEWDEFIKIILSIHKPKPKC